MKKLFLLPLFLIFAALAFLTERKDFSISDAIINNQGVYENSLLKSQKSVYFNTADYNFEIDFDDISKTIYVKEKIVWHNRSKYSTKEIRFHLYPNAYKSVNTLFARGYNLSDPETRTELNIRKILVEGVSKIFKFIHPELSIPTDSTVASIDFENEVNPGDSLSIEIEYDLKIPQSVKRFGYARGRNFFFVSQWFPKVGVFENGKWICSPYYPYLNFYSDFGNYSATISVPHNYTVGSTGEQIAKKKVNNKLVYNITQNGVHDFAWFASDEIILRKQIYKRNDGSEILIKAFVQPEREKYFDRYFKAVHNSLSYFENNIGIYPYKTVTLVDVPRTCSAGGMEYPTLFTVGAELFSPQITGQPEYLVVHEFSHQFFHGLIANNEVYEAWLDEGLTSYISTKIMYEYYPDILEHFKIATHVPIFGINFLSYNEIPVIYTLAALHHPKGYKSAISYYRNLSLGSISDSSHKMPNRLSYVVNAYSKPELVLLTLDNYLGSKAMMRILREYYNRYKFKHPTGKDFISLVEELTEENMAWFFENFYSSSRTFDDKIESVKKNSEGNWEVIASRNGSGFFKTEVALFTERQTIIQKWDTDENWKLFVFKTNDKVIAAEIDPFRKNLLDLNFSNNSITLESREAASLSLSIRLFFWIQNALMIMGSIG